MLTPERLDVRAATSARLAEFSDRRLADVLNSAEPLGVGIGGTSSLLEIDGVDVFVKRIPLTELELEPGHRMSTANIFDLPTFYHYGIGSSGFGGWRELAAHTMADQWVTTDTHTGFPLTYHSRVLTGPTAGDTVFAQFGTLTNAVEFWDHSPAVRRRLDALSASTTSIVLFLEHFPWTLRIWLADQPIDTFARVQAELDECVSFLRDRRLVHFDAHFDNILTDGSRLYFSDFGLALSPHFDLAPDEAAFLASHHDYDAHYVSAHLVNHLAERLRPGGDRRQFIADWADGRRSADVPAAAARILDRLARTSRQVSDLRRELIEVSKRTPYPATDLARSRR